MLRESYEYDFVNKIKDMKPADIRRDLELRQECHKGENGHSCDDCPFGKECPETESVMMASMFLDRFDEESRYLVEENAALLNALGDRIDVKGKLRELRRIVWGYDYPCPANPDYELFHHKMQSILDYIDRMLGGFDDEEEIEL